MTEPKKSLLNRSTLIIATTWIVRLICGIVFIYSGFVKAIDPWGTLYKFQDYFAAWHLPALQSLLIVAVFALCIFEFVLGVFILLGAFRRSTPIFAILFMTVMTPLTLWIAIADPVADCGCFGDALILSNWQTFWKNIFLSVLIVWLLKYNTSAKCIVRPSMQWIALLTSAGYITLLGLIGYYYQPLIDFRPYHAGKSLSALYEDEGTTPEYIFIYEKDGERKNFTIDDTLPTEDDGWTFVAREETLPSKPNVQLDSNSSSAPTFRIWSIDGNQDLTEDVLAEVEDMLILLMPDLDNVSISTTWKINALYSWAQENDIEMIAVVAATQQGIDRWEDLALPEYPIYTAEDTEIKMLARGNPAVVFLQNGKIEWKSTLRALPNDDFAGEKNVSNPESLRRDDKTILRNITLLYIAVMAVIACLSFLPAWAQFIRGDKVRREV